MLSQMSKSSERHLRTRSLQNSVDISLPLDSRSSSLSVANKTSSYSYSDSITLSACISAKAKIDKAVEPVSHLSSQLSGAVVPSPDVLSSCSSSSHKTNDRSLSDDRPPSKVPLDQSDTSPQCSSLRNSIHTSVSEVFKSISYSLSKGSTSFSNRLPHVAARTVEPPTATLSSSDDQLTPTPTVAADTSNAPRATATTNVDATKSDRNGNSHFNQSHALYAIKVAMRSSRGKNAAERRKEVHKELEDPSRPLGAPPSHRVAGSALKEEVTHLFSSITDVVRSKSLFKPAHSHEHTHCKPARPLSDRARSDRRNTFDPYVGHLLLRFFSILDESCCSDQRIQYHEPDA